MNIFRRKLLIICILACAVFFQTATDLNAAVVSLAWSANPEPDIAGYKVYYGTSSRNYAMVVNVGKFTSCMISGLATNKTYYFACTAYNGSGLESNYSAEVSYTPRPRRK